MKGYPSKIIKTLNDLRNFQAIVFDLLTNGQFLSRVVKNDPLNESRGTKILIPLPFEVDIPHSTSILTTSLILIKLHFEIHEI